jgi:hypothetical protein
MAVSVTIARGNGLVPFGEPTYGTKVLDWTELRTLLEKELSEYDFNAEDEALGLTKGRRFVILRGAEHLVSGGFGYHTHDLTKYLLREHYGGVESYLQRGEALPVKTTGVVVYDRDTYCRDPDVSHDSAEIERIVSVEQARFVLVCIIGMPLLSTSKHFLKYLAGEKGAFEMNWAMHKAFLREMNSGTLCYARDKCCLVAD